jgi:hypothetical protein
VAFLAFTRALSSDANTTDERRPIIATTTSSSMRVKPREEQKGHISEGAPARALFLFAGGVGEADACAEIGERDFKSGKRDYDRDRE